MKRQSPIKLRDTVAYSAHFLRSVGIYTGDICFARGTVTYLKKFGNTRTMLATVCWNTPGLPNEINAANLVRCDSADFSYNY